MNEKEIEGLLNKLGKTIHVNRELKKELRSSFEGRGATRERKPLRYMAAACALLLIAAVGFSVWMAPLSKVAADPIRVQNYRTYIQVDGNYDLSVAEYNGVMYIPDIQEGIFKSDGEEKIKIYSGRVSMVKISPDGKKLAFFGDGSIGILDLATLESDILVQNGQNISYDLSNWYDNQSILVTKNTIQDPTSSNYDINGGEIIRLNIDSLEQEVLARGFTASYIQSENALLYQRGEDIIIKDLSTNREQIVDQGTQPAASPDGKAIVYAKLHVTYYGIKENVGIEHVRQNLWVADLENYARKTMITSNITLEDIDREEWLSQLKPSDEQQILSLSGRYGYLFPTWSSDSKTIYTLRRDYMNRIAVVVRIDLARASISPKEVVERFLQAIMLKDEDYQSSLTAVEMKAINELKGSRLKDFKVVNEGAASAGVYVEAEIIYDGQDGKAARLRFYLEKQSDQYYIVDLKEMQPGVSSILKDDSSMAA